MSSLEEDLFGAKYQQPINQKQKGNRNELRVAKLLAEWAGHEFVRVPMSGGLRWKNTMNICGDVVSTDPDFKFDYSVETKHLASLGLNSPTMRKNSVVLTHFKQASRDAARSGKKPFLMLRDNGMPKDSYYIFLPVSWPQLVKFKQTICLQFVSHDQTLIGIRSEVLFKKWTYEEFNAFYNE